MDLLLSNIAKEIQKTISAKGEPLVEKVVKAISEFVERNEFITSNGMISEIEVLGMLHGFLSMANEDLNISREPKLAFNYKDLRPDFVIDYEQEKIVIEVKRRFEKHRLKEATEQLLDYLEATDTVNGILYFVKTVEGKPVVSVDKQTVKRNEKDYNIYIITT